MERIELELINEICENQNFDELLLKIVHKSNSKNRINNLLNEIENNKTITRQLKMKLYEEIFEYVSDVNDYLKNNLKDLGIKSVFEPSYASLNNLTNKDAYISEILHKANIDFSNEGIKAAAATEGGGAGDTNCGFDYLYEVPVEEIDITFDLPFMFILRDKNSKEVWFMGSVYEPTEYSESGTCR